MTHQIRPELLRNETILPPCNDLWLEKVSHTCHYCAKLLIKFQSNAAAGNSEIIIKFRTIAKARKAAREGCKLFQEIFNRGGRKRINDEQNYLQFSFETIILNREGINDIDSSVTCKNRDSWDEFGYTLENWSIAVPPSTVSHTQLLANTLLMIDTDDPAAAYITSPSPNLDVGSESAFEFANECLKKCIKYHTSCQPLTPVNEPPCRLIDIADVNEKLKLIETLGTRSWEYAALSYCRGGGQDYKVKTSNIMKYQHELCIPSTAKTIHDAILTTKKLGLRYLWVDALYIIQDSPADLSRELARMPDIYKGAHVTIIAATSKSSATGFFEPGIPQRHMHRLPFQCPNGEIGSILLYHEDPRAGNGPYPIETRVWAMQEDLLSPRILKFGNEMLWWPCVCGTKSNGGKNQLTSRERELTGDGKKTMEGWKRVVANYSKRKVTYPCDKLNAIASIVAEVARISNGHNTGKSARYVAGLWDNDLAPQLLWYNSNVSELRRRPEPYRSPSWSWASVDQ